VKKIPIFYCLLVFSLLFASQLMKAQNTWTRKAFCPGMGKDYPACFSIGSKGYYGTGSTTASPGSNDFWEYDSGTDTWTQKANFPGVARWIAAGLSIGNFGYIGMGLDQSSNLLKDFYCYDPMGNTWTRKTDFGGGIRAGLVAFSIGNKGYAGTGCAALLAAFENDFWEYDPVADTWTRKAPLPASPRMDGSGFAIGTKGFLGIGHDSLGYLSDFWEWDQGTNQWTQKANFGGGGRCDAASFVIGCKGFICLGETADTVHVFRKDLWEFDPLANSWTRKADFGGTRRDETNAFTVAGKGYVGLGPDTTGLERDLWEYTPDSTILACGDTSHTVVKSCLVVPNVFSPNGDQTNDLFAITGKNISTYSCEIFDRWGIKLFESSQLALSWDGRTNSGMPATPGVYYYLIKASGSDGVHYDEKGFLTLIR
jgi:gliding motility-associated-like protein